MFEGAPNFRDLGGLDAGEGRRVREGLLFRSESLAALTDADLVRFAKLGVRVVCDVRAPEEREKHPNRWPEGGPWRTYTPEHLEGDVGFDVDSIVEAAAGGSYETVKKLAIGTYETLPGVLSPLVGDVLAGVDRGELPLLIHCALGKDRTAIMAAIILEAIGVPPAVIRDDYLLTDRFVGFERLLPLVGSIADPDIAPGIARAFCVHPEYLEAMYGSVDARYGSFDSYLDASGVDASMRDRLRSRLTE